MSGIVIRGECIRCGVLILFKAELVCKNQQQCTERQDQEPGPDAMRADNKYSVKLDQDSE